MRKLLGCLRRAIDDYSMISAGDHIAVGLSGGKDSVTLLEALSLFRRFSPQPFTLSAINIDLGFAGTKQDEMDALTAYCERIDVPFYVVKTDIGKILFEERKETNPCSLCSKMRRGALNTKCQQIGANKLALGHNLEDVLDTFLLSFVYEGRLSTFQPVSYLTRTDMTVIRPFIYAEEGDIKGAVRRLGLPIVQNPCPSNHTSQREFVKNIYQDLCKTVPFAKDRMAAAVVHQERYHLFPPKTKTDKATPNEKNDQTDNT